jgi:hypothetical protein
VAAVPTGLALAQGGEAQEGTYETKPSHRRHARASHPRRLRKPQPIRQVERKRRLCVDLPRDTDTAELGFDADAFDFVFDAFVSVDLVVDAVDLVFDVHALDSAGLDLEALGFVVDAVLDPGDRRPLQPQLVLGFVEPELLRGQPPPERRSR